MKTNSQAYQDVAASIITPGKGRYLEIGSGIPDQESNTYVLDTVFGWSGICIDAANYDYSSRSCKFVNTEAVRWLQNHCRDERFDYISFDIDETTTLAVQAVLDNNVQFRFATVEHDKYKHGYKYQNSQHQFLSSAGYVAMFIDICTSWDEAMIFEDWWCHRDVCDKTLGVGLSPLEAIRQVESNINCSPKTVQLSQLK